MNTVTLNSTQKPEADWNYGDIVVISGVIHIITRLPYGRFKLHSLHDGYTAFQGEGDASGGIKAEFMQIAKSYHWVDDVRYIGPCDITLTPKVQA